MGRRILIATGNEGKLREILAIVSGLPVRWSSLNDFPSVESPIEDGRTFESNAAKKALHYAAHTGIWTLADDSGLEVDALGGAPGVHSARYAAAGDDAANNRKVVEALEGIPIERRSARFVCCVALADSRAILAAARGMIEGRIIDRPRGRNGFGYDPHFLLPELGATTAELPPEHKNQISHRARALRALLPQIDRLLAAADYRPDAGGA